MLTKLAWRNIWRNKRRTLITASAVAFAVFFASAMVAIQKGTWDNVVNNSVNLFFGYAQIHSNGYWDEQTLDKAFFPDDQMQLAQEISQVKGAAPRLESFALASEGNITTGVMVVGIDPEKENSLTNLGTKVIDGQYLRAKDQSVIVASGVAKKLKLQLNDTLILVSQGYHGVNAAGKFPISGIFEYALPDLNKRMVYMPLETAQEFYGANGLVTTVALKINDADEVAPAVKKLRASLPEEDYEVLDYEEMIPELIEAKELDTASGNLILGILYLIITFGIFGTILMMTKEREYEFGVLTAIGMKRWKLSIIVWMETIFIGLLGALLGILLSFPIVYYFYANPLDLSVMGEEAVQAYEKFGIEPVMKAAFEPSIFIGQAIIIFIVTTVLAIYPFWKINRLKPVEAMRS